jgi:hypothetical protein
MAIKIKPANGGPGHQAKGAAEIWTEMVGPKEITHSNLSWGDNPERLLATAGNLGSWVNKDTQIPSLLAALIVKGRTEHKMMAAYLLGAAAKEGLNTYTLMHTLGEAMQYSLRAETVAPLRNIIIEKIRPSGLPEEEVLSAWLKTENMESLGRILFLNMNSLEVLQKERPEAAKALHDTYGISCFGRYRPETLVRLYDSMGEVPNTIGLMITSRSDWDGMFYDLSGTIEALSRDFNVKIIEGEEPEQLRRLLQNVKLKHKKRAQFAVVAMHADTLKSLLDKVMGGYDEMAREFFEDKPTYVFVSSLVSVPDGPKERLEAHGAKVIGPPHIIYQCPKKFDFRKTADGRVEFDVAYSKERF